MRIKSLQDYKPGDTRHKLLPFTQENVKASADASNPDVAGEIEGFAAGLLNIDRGQDIIFPGAFNKDLQEFKDTGVVCYQHDWTAVIGKPTFVEERLEPDYGLFTRSEITATSLGSDVMKLVKRAVLKTLSIGYRLKPGGFSILNREALAATLKDRAIPQAKTEEILSDFDRRKLSEVFGLFDITLFEYSVVTRPMNANAAITGAKGDGGEGGDLLDGLPFSIHPLVVLGAVKGYAERLKDSRAKYADKNRNVSITHKEGIKNIREAVESLLPDLKAVEEEVNAELATEEEINRVLSDVLLTESKLLGVA